MSRSAQPLPQVGADTSDGVVGLGYVAGPHLEHVLHLGEHVDANVDTGRLRLVGDPSRVVEQRLVVTHLDVERRQPAQVAVERNPDLRVVYMSGHTEDVLVRSGARARNLAFVQKPFTRATLLRAVEDALAAAPGAELAAER